ncbi:conserved domain protein [delta proteobacterium NaphS2]|nr:conserved domain protein [delta proteobacterium NaphS2]
MGGLLAADGRKCSHTPLALETQESVVELTSQNHETVEFQEQVLGDLRLEFLIKFPFLVENRKVIHGIRQCDLFPRHIRPLSQRFFCIFKQGGDKCK